MSDNSSPVWQASPHTLMKHKILDRYLDAWLAILGKDQCVLYVDGFAGPGIYEDGEKGSPILAIEAAIDHKSWLQIRYLFVEKDPRRVAILQQQIEKVERAKNNPRILGMAVKQGDCNQVLLSVLDNPRAHGLTAVSPALFFLDQFGYSDVPIPLISRIMGNDKCEVLTYLEGEKLSTFISDPNKAAAATLGFGSEDWKPAKDMSLFQRHEFLRDLYKATLEREGGARYVIDFSMYDDKDRLLYWLFFCTNNIRGLEEMKKAMWAVDSSGGFRYSDRDSCSQIPLYKFDDARLAEYLSTRLRGQLKTIGEVREHVLTCTPAYKYSSALELLENEKAISIPNSPEGRRKGSFLKYQDMTISFAETRPPKAPKQMLFGDA